MKVAVSRIVNVLNCFLASLFPKGTRVTTLESEAVHLAANRAEHTKSPISFLMEPVQPFLSCVEVDKSMFQISLEEGVSIIYFCYFIL